MQQDFESRFSGFDDRIAGLESGGSVPVERRHFLESHVETLSFPSDVSLSEWSRRGETG
ncbi:hypothetical protein [Burkholderia stabilis]|uniref:hypothetical protein n=1 Tax=Burkholderia stabilis TaxID=95485 RepID=UPI0013CE4476|nr:hypothetical protein [Burkholderia stabilis]